MEQLLAGYRRFRATQWQQQRPLLESLAARGQRPRSLVIACIDSRVDPATIFDAPPGEMLTLRNVANLVPPYAPDPARHGTSAALEFGVRVLEVPHLIVLGHSGCGGIASLLRFDPLQPADFITSWMSIAEPVRRMALGVADPEARHRLGEQEAIKLSLANLLTFPWIAERAAARTLALHGAWFDIATGSLALLTPGGAFAPVD